MEENEWTIKDWFSNVTCHSSADGAAALERQDAGGKTARELARMFVERFPETAAHGTGHDLAYAEWFAGMMATAESGGLPVYFADFEIDLSDVSVPPPPDDIY